MDGRTCQAGSVGRAFFFFFFFFFFNFISGSKNDPKNNNNNNNNKIFLNLNFVQKNFGKIFWFIFKNFQQKFSDIGRKTAYFTRFWKH